ncbi:hypothetical protein AUR64_06415 [Haloprofundus marisrubri]|uniref:Uncharacterized protein n=1 Tax=Haloprofundus marisrubri TaxID=1514971 RepID=A0A0W1RC33_9EURY|nr:hypothetical protein [Haloprofundus marisrubri]KTG10820.1 hypothetical protein AUR64_06415 [Haloprofundus marisrubri]
MVRKSPLAIFVITRRRSRLERFRSVVGPLAPYGRSRYNSRATTGRWRVTASSSTTSEAKPSEWAEEPSKARSA